MGSAAEPVREERADGILTVVLDTPGCDVNIFSHQAAVQLGSILDRVDPADTRALILRSGKSGSFVNGVGLMLASAVQAPTDVARLTEPVRAAYAKLGACPVPTIAAVQGNCYGCGVELSLMCDYRVAQHSWDTHFYMTEIADYLFVPCFGGTQHLPRLLGLEAATDFLLWGTRWTAPQAEHHGLVDAVLDHGGFDDGLAAFVADVAAARRAPRPRGPRANHAADFAARTRARIASLPSRVRQVYSDCFELLEHAASAPGVADADYEREMLASGRSVMHTDSKNAQSFFFVRQLARRMAVRHAPPASSAKLILCDLPSFEAELQRRRLLEVEVFSSDDAPTAGLRLGPYGDDDRVDATLATLPIRAAIEWGPGIVAYAPCHASGIDVVEIAMRDDGLAPRAAWLADLFAKAGFEAVLSRPDRRFAIDRLMDAYFGPLHAHVEAGGTAAEVDASLRAFGFTRGPAALAALVPEHSGARLFGSQPLPAAEPVARVVHAVLLSLLGFALDARLKGLLGHPSLVDVLARDLLDFPLAEGSLCRHLSPARVGELLGGAGELAPLVGPTVLDAAREYHARGDAFYR
jgi:enoyl-CoA hydratase/carnithine racemase